MDVKHESGCARQLALGLVSCTAYKEMIFEKKGSVDTLKTIKVARGNRTRLLIAGTGSMSRFKSH